MKILFEGYQYSVDVLQKYISSHFYTVNRAGTMGVVNFVGYFFNYNPQYPENTDAIFILPKVFLNSKSEPFEFAGKRPEDFLDLNDENNKMLKENGVAEMVFELSVWLYQAIAFYHQRILDTQNLENSSIQNVVSNRGEDSATYLDTVLQLRKFYKDHRNLFTFVSIINNSGHNKIHWAKTISHEQPIIKNNRPAYVNFRTKERVINFDEEIIVLFYSVLDFLKHRFHFQVNVNIQYQLLSHKRIQGMIESCRGTRYLKKIRKKYFTDEFVALWKLLYAFFEKAERVASKRYHEETLLTKDFNTLFEDMVDYLISDDDNPKELVAQRDNKLVDHLYHEESLVYNEHIYFVGDSKYYKQDQGPRDDSESVYKQYTYAKNIIQRNINVIEGFEYGDSKHYFHYRDDITQGYNITPNFFISGVTKRDEKTGKYITSEHQLENITGENMLYNRHYRNRLFDRDTLILQRYNINFLYVLTAYAAQQQISRDAFRKVTRAAFRNDITKALNDHYKVYQVCLPDSGDDSLEISKFVKRNFYELSGRIFSFDNILLYAEEKNETNSLIEIEEGSPMLHLEDENVELEEIRLGNHIEKKYKKLVEIDDESSLESVFGMRLPIVEDDSGLPIKDVVDESDEYCVPIYSIKAACGRFLEADEEAYIEAWMDTEKAGYGRKGNEYFIVQASGDSMLTKIHDGDYCLFRHDGSIHNGNIVIAGIHDMDEDYNGRFTIKEFHQVFKYNEDGVRERTEVTLSPLNTSGDFPTFTLDEESGDGFGVFGVLEYVFKK